MQLAPLLFLAVAVFAACSGGDDQVERAQTLTVREQATASPSATSSEATASPSPSPGPSPASSQWMNRASTGAAVTDTESFFVGAADWTLCYGVATGDSLVLAVGADGLPLKLIVVVEVRDDQSGQLVQVASHEGVAGTSDCSVISAGPGVFYLHVSTTASRQSRWRS